MGEHETRAQLDPHEVILVPHLHQRESSTSSGAPRGAEPQET
jgi:hypothetical protein